MPGPLSGDLDIPTGGLRGPVVTRVRSQPSESHIFDSDLDDSLRQASPFGLTKPLCPRHEGAAPPLLRGRGGLVYRATSVFEDNDRAMLGLWG